MRLSTKINNKEYIYENNILIIREYINKEKEVIQHAIKLDNFEIMKLFRLIANHMVGLFLHGPLK